MSSDSPNQTDRLPLTDADFMAIIQLLGDVSGMTCSIPDRRRTLVSNLAKLIDADMWAWTHSRFGASDLAAFFFIDGGFESDLERTRLRTSANDPEFNRIFSAYWWPRMYGACRTSDIALGSSEADRAILKQKLEHAGVSDSVFCLYTLDEATLSGIGLHRRKHKPEFTIRERAIAHVLLSQIDWLHRAETDVPANQDLLLDLSPRQREVLINMLGGEGRKQIARKMQLSEYTIDEHTQAIYKQFKVTSKPELLSLFISGRMK